MAMRVFLLLCLTACCVGAAVAEGPPGFGKANEENLTITTEAMQPPPAEDAKLADLKVRLGKVNKENVTTSTDTNSSETGIQPPPAEVRLAVRLENLEARLRKVKEENTTNNETGLQPPPLDKQLKDDLADLMPKVGTCLQKEARLDKRGEPVLDFLTCGIESMQQLEALAATMYCLNGQKVPRDCQDAYNGGLRRSGVYKVSPDGRKQFDVYCEQELDGGGWTVIQQRFDGSENFYRGWTDYKDGFGTPGSEVWLGNDNIYLLTSNHNQKLKVELKYGKEVGYADYMDFYIGNEGDNYRLAVSTYTGTVGDSLSYHNGHAFSTHDKDNDGSGGNCAHTYSGAWWYHSCYYSNLNGLLGDNSHKAVVWQNWKGWQTSMSGTRMLVKPR